MPNELISNQGTKKAAEVLDDLAQRLRDLGECSKSMQHVGIVIPRDDMQRLARGLGDISGFVAALEDSQRQRREYAQFREIK